jgi:hypothetical protein
MNGVQNCEVDSYFFPIKVGDHIVFSVDVTLTPSTVGDTYPYDGALIDIDIYGATGRICGLSAPDGSAWTQESGYPSNNAANIVPFGGARSIKMDFIVAATYEADGFGGNYATGSAQVPTGMIPTMFVQTNGNGGQTEGAIATFSNVQLFINPTSTPTSVSINFVASSGGALAWTDLTANTAGLTGSISFPINDQIQVNATPLTGFQFNKYTTTYKAGNIGTYQGNPYTLQATASFDGAVITASFVATSPTPPPYTPPSGSISVGGTPYGGYMLLPPCLVRVLWRLREKYIRKEVHRKLHPLV